MKIFIELDEDELKQFILWRRMMEIKQEKDERQRDFDAKNGKTDITVVTERLTLKTAKAVIESGVKTVEQARAMTDTEWLSKPGFGKVALKALRAELDVNYQQSQRK